MQAPAIHVMQAPTPTVSHGQHSLVALPKHSGGLCFLPRSPQAAIHHALLVVRKHLSHYPRAKPKPKGGSSNVHTTQREAPLQPSTHACAQVEAFRAKGFPCMESSNCSNCSRYCWQPRRQTQGVLHTECCTSLGPGGVINQLLNEAGCMCVWERWWELCCSDVWPRGAREQAVPEGPLRACYLDMGRAGWSAARGGGDDSAMMTLESVWRLRPIQQGSLVVWERVWERRSRVCQVNELEFGDVHLGRSWSTLVKPRSSSP